MYGKVKCIEGQGAFYMFEHRTHSTQVFARKVYWAVLCGRQDRTTDDSSALEYSK